MTTLLEPLATLLPRVQHWLADDPDDDTRAQLAQLLAECTEGNAAHALLSDCFRGTLRFGTAGLRGALGPGPNRMNRATVMRAAAGLGKFLKDASTNSSIGLVVVGFDARHGSAQFAHDTCAVLTGMGIQVQVLPQALPTPVLAFAVQYLQAAAGVMVTASHNPARDNGYKVYLGPSSGLDYQGSQIIPPVDGEIAQRIDSISTVNALPLDDEWVVLDDSVKRAYVARSLSVVSPSGPRDIRVVHTAMHGVGSSTFHAAALAAGFVDVHCVNDQEHPDPDFPTVAFPNPEEPGALDLAYARARECDADIIIAHDPDADRCAVALPVAQSVGKGREHATWQRLTGDEVGVILGWWLIEQARLGWRHLPPHPVFANSIVSGTLLSRLCAAHSIAHTQTLTGFKWLAQVPDLTFGYEEALGYCIDPGAVHDKDGITASLAIMECAAHLRSVGRTLHDLLVQLRDDLGGGYTGQVSVTVRDIDAVSGLFRTLTAPQSLPGASIVAAANFADGIDGLPPTQGIRWVLADDSRIIIRPSGTEPKVKVYIESGSREKLDELANACRTMVANLVPRQM